MLLGATALPPPALMDAENTLTALTTDWAILACSGEWLWMSPRNASRLLSSDEEVVVLVAAACCCCDIRNVLNVAAERVCFLK